MSEIISPGESLVMPEKELEKNSTVAFVGTTRFLTWNRESQDPNNPDVTRGNQVLQNVRQLLSWGYRVVIIDGGSSEEFLTALTEVAAESNWKIQGQIKILNQEGNSMSSAQRQGYQIASAIPGIKAILTTQPEKPFDYEDLSRFTEPILSGEADMVIPNRTSRLEDYPPKQKHFELAGNEAMSEALRYLGLLHGDTVLDIYNGTRVFKNDPEIIEAMMVEFNEKNLNFYSGLSSDSKLFLPPDQWFAALYAPVAKLLFCGKKVVSVDTNYQHPQEQTRQETGNPAFDRKRFQQYMAIVPYFYDYLIWLIHHDNQ